MIPGDLFAVLAFGLAVGVAVVERIGIRQFEPRKRIARALARVPATRIADVRDGALIKIVGRVRLVEPSLRAPLTRRRCAFYQLVERVVDDNSGARPERLSELRACDFLVEDATGRALVRAHGARIGATFDEIGGPRHRVAVGSGEHRFREAALVENARVAVGGVARWEPDPSPPPDAMSSYRDVPQRLVLEASKKLEVLVCDVDEE